MSEQLGVLQSSVFLESSFQADLGADSLDTVELLLAFEEEFEIKLPYEIQDPGVATNIPEAIQFMVTHEPRQLLNKIDTQIIAFYFTPDGKVQVSLQLEDGSWTYADGSILLPSKLYLATFSKWGNVLKELEDLINSQNTTERDLQKFFEEYPELIAGDDYDVVIPQAAISRIDSGETWKADFILAPVEQTEFCKIIELKIPHMPLIKRPRSGHVSFSARAWNALAQLKDYFCSFDREQVRKNFQSKYGIDVYKPDLHLIAGRRWDLQWMDNIRELRRTSEIHVEDWDSALQRLRRRYA